MNRKLQRDNANETGMLKAEIQKLKAENRRAQDREANLLEFKEASLRGTRHQDLPQGPPPQSKETQTLEIKTIKPRPNSQIYPPGIDHPRLKFLREIKEETAETPSDTIDTKQRNNNLKEDIPNSGNHQTREISPQSCGETSPRRTTATRRTSKTRSQTAPNPHHNRVPAPKSTPPHQQSP
jgi:hypothetical protein